MSSIGNTLQCEPQELPDEHPFCTVTFDAKATLADDEIMLVVMSNNGNNALIARAIPHSGEFKTYQMSIPGCQSTTGIGFSTDPDGSDGIQSTLCVDNVSCECTPNEASVDELNGLVYLGQQHCNSADDGTVIDEDNPYSGTVDIAGTATVGRLHVELEMRHTRVGDLSIVLTSPSGVTQTIVNRVGVPATADGCTGDDIDVTLDKTAPVNIENVCGDGTPTLKGTFNAGGVLAQYEDTQFHGTWTLEVTDHGEDDSGHMVKWCVEDLFDP